MTTREAGVGRDGDDGVGHDRAGPVGQGLGGRHEHAEPQPGDGDEDRETALVPDGEEGGGQREHQDRRSGATQVGHQPQRVDQGGMSAHDGVELGRHLAVERGQGRPPLLHQQPERQEGHDAAQHHQQGQHAAHAEASCSCGRLGGGRRQGSGHRRPVRGHRRDPVTCGTRALPPGGARPAGRGRAGRAGHERRCAARARPTRPGRGTARPRRAGPTAAARSPR